MKTGSSILAYLIISLFCSQALCEVIWQSGFETSPDDDWDHIYQLGTITYNSDAAHSGARGSDHYVPSDGTFSISRGRAGNGFLLGERHVRMWVNADGMTLPVGNDIAVLRDVGSQTEVYLRNTESGYVFVSRISSVGWTGETPSVPTDKSQWHQIDLYLKTESSPGANDGEARVWIDKTPCFEKTDLGEILETHSFVMGIASPVEGDTTEFGHVYVDDVTVWDELKIPEDRFLIASSGDGGDVTDPGEGSFAYEYGTVVDVVAVADEQYHFVGWTGTAVLDGKVADPSRAATTVTMDGDYTLQAEFAYNEFVTDWFYRRLILIDHTRVMADLTDFPVLVDITDADLSGKPQLGGDDFMFTDAAGNKLDHELEEYEDASGHVVAWVRIPLLSSDVDTQFYMYYGNPAAANQENPAGTWDAGYKAVWHLNQTAGGAGSVLDSTSNAHDGTDFGSPAFDSAGKIGPAVELDGLDDFLDFGNPADLQFGDPDDFTVEAWYKSLQNGTSHGIVSKDQTTDDYGWALTKWYSDDRLSFEIESGSASRERAYSDVAYQDTEWHHVVGVREGGIAMIYVDGVAQAATTSIPLLDSGEDLLIGRFYSDYNGLYSRGVVDEARISDVARSAEWIGTEHNNQASPGTFYSVGSEEIAGVNIAPILTNPVPADGETGVALEPTLSIHAVDVNGDPMTITFQTDASGSWTDLAVYADVGNGTYSAMTSGIFDQHNTTYNWRVTASDSVEVTTKTYTLTTLIAPAPWWNDEWPYRKVIEIDHNQVDASLTGFPVLVDVTDPDLQSKAQPDGDDITFTTYDGTQLDHEIEDYDPASGHLVAWVNVPSLSSTENTHLYMYYGHPGVGSQANPEAVWDSDYKMVQHINETLTGTTGYIAQWTNYAGNPILTPGSGENSSAFSTVLIVDGTYHMYYSVRESSTGYYRIAHATSTDGKNWVKDDANNPVLDLVPGSDWESTMVYVPCVWIEDGTWYMVYTGRGGGVPQGNLEQIGLATSTDGISWTRSPSNPILTGGEDWEGITVENFGVIKVGDTYYMEYESQDNATSDRSIGIATSTDLVNWTKDARNPIWTGNRYCGSWFKRGSYFYHLVPHGTTIELWRDTHPTFYPEDRELVKTPIVSGALDTPWVLTDDIYKDTFPNDELWCYYATPSWITNLTIDTDVDAAVAIGPGSPPDDVIYDSTAYHNDGGAVGAPSNTPGIIDGAADFDVSAQDAFNCGNDGSLDFSAFTLEAWAKLPDAGSGGPSGNGWMTMMEKGDTSSTRYGLWTQYGRPAVIVNGNLLYASTSDLLQDGMWAQIVATHDGATTRVFVNGVESANTTGWVLTPSNTAGDDFMLGQAAVSGSVGWWQGSLDEVRVSDTARSPEWISTQYNNQHDPAAFVNFGGEEAGVPPESPVVANEYPPDGSAGVELNPTLSVNVVDYQGDTMDIKFLTDASGSWEQIGTTQSGGNGTYTQDTTMFDTLGTSYSWRVEVTDRLAAGSLRRRLTRSR